MFLRRRVSDAGLRRAAREARRVCTGRDSFRNGACAADVAASARLGRFDAAWAEMLRSHDRGDGWPRPPGCRVAVPDTGCPEGQEIEYADYPSLVEQRYIGSAQAADRP